MADIKYTKNELTRLQTKLAQLMRYLPTLQLKKTLLQKEVNKANEEVARSRRLYEEEKESAREHFSLLTDHQSEMVFARAKIVRVERAYDNIAGIEMPFLEDVIFEEPYTPMLLQPVWFDSAVALLRSLQKARQKIVIAEEKRDLLAEELRTVSVRVNLFEKRLIPETEGDMGKIRVFLGDQDLQAVVQAKVSKNKILEKKQEARLR